MRHAKRDLQHAWAMLTDMMNVFSVERLSSFGRDICDQDELVKGQEASQVAATWPPGTVVAEFQTALG